MGEDKNSIFKKLTIAILVAVVVIFAIGMAKEKKRLEANKEIKEQQLAQEKKEKERIDKLSLYEKINEGLDINILIVGDDIGLGSGASTSDNTWYNKLATWLEDEYKVNTNIINMSSKEATSKTGYDEFMEDETDYYDLVFLCFGQNDKIEMKSKEFSKNYQSLVKEIIKRKENAEIIPILEHSMDRYDNYTDAILDLCQDYDLEYADTIKAFLTSQTGYSDLVTEEDYPNDVGQELYFDTIKEILNENINGMLN